MFPWFSFKLSISYTGKLFFKCNTVEKWIIEFGFLNFALKQVMQKRMHEYKKQKYATVLFSIVIEMALIA